MLWTFIENCEFDVSMIEFGYCSFSGSSWASDEGA